LGNFVAIWYIFPRFGNLHQEKSGNPAIQVECISEIQTFAKSTENFEEQSLT
jgi:hypothetical protein